MARKRKRPSTRREKQPELPPGVSLRHTLTGHGREIDGVAVTGDGRRAVSGSNDRTLKLWDLENGKALRTLAGHSKDVYCVGLTGGGRCRAPAIARWKAIPTW